MRAKSRTGLLFERRLEAGEGRSGGRRAAAVAVLLGGVPRPSPGQAMAEEPVKPKGRSRKPQPASTSLFEWAMELEREGEPVGTGR